MKWTLADGDGFQCSSSSASSVDYDDDPPLKKLCVLLCMPQNAPEFPLNCQNFLAKHPPDPPIVNGCMAAMFSISANDIAPQIEKVIYGPAKLRLKQSLGKDHLAYNITFEAILRGLHSSVHQVSKQVCVIFKCTSLCIFIITCKWPG